MRLPARMRSRSGSRDGVALVIVLTFIVLLTILIVSFLTFSGLNRTSTSSYSKSIQAQEIAQGGLQDILQDLHSEIIAGSTVQNGGSAAYPSAYIPSTNYTATPARIGYGSSYWGTDVGTGTFSPSLIRVSRATGNTSSYATGGDAFFTSHPTYYSTANLPNSSWIVNRASLSSTATPSSNGRYISAARWNKTYLLATNAAAVPTPFTGAPPDWVYVTRTGSRVCTTAEITAAAPNNLMPSNNLTNNYGTVTPGTTPPASPIVGRYAFVMYDEGALLDANAAGYPSTATNTTTATPTYTTTTAPLTSQTLSGKSYLSYADLTQIPGFYTVVGRNTTPNQSQVDTLVNWRNASAGTSPITGANYLKAMFTNGQNGFLSAQSGDSPFVSRQDLINYFTSIDPGINTGTATYSQALPYLGTFTREVNAPSYFPPLDASAIPLYNASLATLSPVPTYHTSMETSGIANRDLANVRFAGTGTITITHYSDSGTASTYTVSAGDPLLQRRFSLARIGWLKSTALGGVDPSGTNPTTGAGPSSTYATAIQSCFGLVWDYPGGSSTTVANGGNKCWNYVGDASEGNTTSSPPSSIETLDLVAAEGREPNFFELLKAAILKGSLGKDPGPAATSNRGAGTGEPAGCDGVNGYYSHTFGAASTVPAPAQIPDIQIIQIGANIIDQYGSDGYPTAIYFRYLSGATQLAFDPVVGPTANPLANYGLYGPVDMVYGDKNLPSITRIMQSWCSTANNGTSGTPHKPTTDTSYDNANSMSCFLQPELWNPHQVPITTLTSVPQNFEIRAYGSSYSTWGYQGSTAGKTWVSGQSYSTSFYQGTGSTETCTIGTATFTDSAGGSSSTPSSFYAHPWLLTQSGTYTTSIPNVTAGSPNASDMAPTSSAQAGWAYPYYTEDPFVAFCAGMTPTATGATAPYQPYYVSPGSSPPVGSAQIGSSLTTPITYVLGWLDSSSNFHPYSFFTGAFTCDYNVINNGSAKQYAGSCLPDDTSPFYWCVLDPRTSRFSISGNNFGGSWKSNMTPFAATGDHYSIGLGLPNITGYGFSPSVLLGTSYNNAGGTPEDWAVNSASAAPNGTATTSPYFYYADPDGVVRPGDDYFGNPTTGDGLMLFTSAGTGGTAVGDTVSTGNATGNTQHGRRPIILNRPFRNVGELGYVFRDEPFKTLDFFSTSSADAALLDVFSTTEEPKVVAGRLALNNAPLPVIESVLSMGLKKELDPSYSISGTVAATIAPKIANAINPATSGSPILNRAGLVTSLSPLSTTQGIHSGFSTSEDKDNKAYFEAPVRALSDVVNTRTWNLLVDVIAQSGQLSPTAKSLDNFVVEGEKRYWLHIAIDRYTGKIIDQQLEPVYE